MNIPIWTGVSTFAAGQTPFGFYDTDNSFQNDVVTTADWCAKRLGYPLVDIELQPINIFTAFEEHIDLKQQSLNFGIKHYLDKNKVKKI